MSCWPGDRCDKVETLGRSLVILFVQIHFWLPFLQTSKDQNTTCEQEVGKYRKTWICRHSTWLSPSIAVPDCIISNSWRQLSRLIYCSLFQIAAHAAEHLYYFAMLITTRYVIPDWVTGFPWYRSVQMRSKHLGEVFSLGHSLLPVAGRGVHCLKHRKQRNICFSLMTVIKRRKKFKFLSIGLIYLYASNHVFALFVFFLSYAALSFYFPELLYPGRLSCSISGPLLIIFSFICHTSLFCSILQFLAIPCMYFLFFDWHFCISSTFIAIYVFIVLCGNVDLLANCTPVAAHLCI